MLIMRGIMVLIASRRQVCLNSQGRFARVRTSNNHRRINQYSSRKSRAEVTAKQFPGNCVDLGTVFYNGPPKFARVRPGHGSRVHESERGQCTYTHARADARSHHSTGNAFARRRRRHFQWHGLCTKCYSFSAVASMLDAAPRAGKKVHENAVEALGPFLRRAG